jgi:hypothetical protein
MIGWGRGGGGGGCKREGSQKSIGLFQYMLLLFVLFKKNPICVTSLVSTLSVIGSPGPTWNRPIYTILTWVQTLFMPPPPHTHVKDPGGLHFRGKGERQGTRKRRKRALKKIISASKEKDQEKRTK